jgi:hypothetical protein
MLIGGLIPIRAQRSNMPLVGAHLRVRPGNGQTRGSAPTDAGILQLEIEFVSSVRKRIGLKTCWDTASKSIH